MDEQCTWYDVGCHLGNWIGSIGQTATDKLAQSVASAAQWALELSGDFIVNISGLTLFNQTEASWVQSTLAPFVSSMAVVAVLVAAIQMIWNQRGEPARELVASLMRLVVVSGASMTGIILATQAADELATWLIKSSGGSGDFMANMASFIKLNEAMAPFAIVLAGIVAIVGALILAMLLLARGVMLTLLMGVLPLTAAASNTSWGQDWFKKASSWTVAFILYKPAVAIILALGYRLMGSPTAAQATATVDDMIHEKCGFDPFDPSGPGASEWRPRNPINPVNEIGLHGSEWHNCADQVRAQLEAGGLDTTGAISFLQGLIIVCFAALAMPALIRFIMPAASAMSSGGGAALGALAGGVGTMVVAGGARHLGSSGSASGNSGSTGSGGGGPSGASATPGGGSGGGQSPGGAPADSGDAPGSSGGPSEGGAAGGGNTGGTPSGSSPVTASGGGLAAVTAAYQVGSEVAGGVSAEVSGQTGDE
ncbi:hypothetical protein QPC17_00145 [Trueperella bernardiae]|uniref:hypothetical protein n=2 Tax=Trueperella bernardiae TaxID=59561 RepID=UPI00255634EC|nr:hypothetical protein [Trueperella bernardiae]WIM07994.1 hypothetical protein QPC17_00145 [Trueperella bernardiae]